MVTLKISNFDHFFYLQILKQVNKEFIAAIANENGKRLLLIIDQHAVHERIRYEWLIESMFYKQKCSVKKINKNNSLYSFSNLALF